MQRFVGIFVEMQVVTMSHISEMLPTSARTKVGKQLLPDGLPVADGGVRTSSETGYGNDLDVGWRR